VAVIVDSEGIVDRASAVGAGRIRWDEIEDERTADKLRAA